MQRQVFLTSKQCQQIIASCMFFVLTSIALAQPALAADSFTLNYTQNDIQTYDPTGTPSCSNGTSGSSTTGASKLDGFTLPASSGRTGDEEAINANGQVGSTGHPVTFSQFAKLGQEYRDYYITMRWNYVAWNWNGTASGVDNAQLQW